jgi:hypothetical protein
MFALSAHPRVPIFSHFSPHIFMCHVPMAKWHMQMGGGLCCRAWLSTKFGKLMPPKILFLCAIVEYANNECMLRGQKVKK